MSSLSLWLLAAAAIPVLGVAALALVLDRALRPLRRPEGLLERAPAESLAGAAAWGEVDRWAGEHGFRRLGVFRFRGQPLVAWEAEDGARTLTAHALAGRVVHDLVTLLGPVEGGPGGAASGADEVRLESFDGDTVNPLPMPPGLHYQHLPGLGLDDLWHLHLDAEAALLEARGLVPRAPLEPFEARYVRSLRQMADHLRRVPLWQVRAVLGAFGGAARDRARPLREQLGLGGPPGPALEGAAPEPPRAPISVELGSGARPVHPARRRGAVLLLSAAVAVWIAHPWRTPGPPGAALALPEGGGEEAPLAFVEHVLGGASPGAELPLIVALHGLGDTPENFGRLFARLGQPARLVLPVAPDWLPVGRSWYPIEEGDSDEAVARAAARVVALTEALEAERPTRGRPILTGFSQGAVLAYTVAVEHPDAFGLVIPIAGGYVGELPEGHRAPAGAPPVRALHGADDPIVGADWGRWSVGHLAERGYDATLRAFPGTGHGVSGEMRERLLEGLREALAGAAAPASLAGVVDVTAEAPAPADVATEVAAEVPPAVLAQVPGQAADGGAAAGDGP